MRSIAIVAALAVCLSTADASAAILEKNGLRLFGDYRVRLEADWDSQDAGGVDRDDRTRMRIRARLGLSYEPGEQLSLGVRLRTGSDFSQQSPHITILDFDDNDTGDAHVNLDKWFVEARRNRFRGWAGRNGIPFWKQNEMFWDDDVTPVGIAGGLETPLGERGKITAQLGYFSLPVGMQDFSGNLASAQLVYTTEIGDARLTAALGHLAIDSNRDDPDAASLIRGNGTRDYAIWVAGLQGRFSAGELPIVLGADLLNNSESYPSVDPMLPAGDPDQFTFDNRDETDGYVLSIKLGDLAEKGDWLAAYTIARIETFAVNSSYSQDDWIRWGSATGGRASNMKGDELRFAYALGNKSNLVLRLYLVEAITPPEDGKRFRVDYNRRF